MSSKLTELEAFIQPIVASMDYELWGISLLSRGSGSILRVYIERTAGITLDDCVSVSRQISACLDVEDPISGKYVLEVSSPGIDRPLFRLSHYALNTGKQIKVSLLSPFDGRKKYQGTLSGTDQETQEISMICEEHEFSFPLEAIDHANIVPGF